MVHVDALSCLPWRAGPSTQRVLARRQAGWVHARRPRHEEAPGRHCQLEPINSLKLTVPSKVLHANVLEALRTLIVVAAASLSRACRGRPSRMIMRQRCTTDG